MFRCRLEPELAIEPRTELSVGRECVVLAAERIEGEHGRSLRTLAEVIECRSRLRMRQRRSVVELRQRGISGVEMRAENPPAIGASELLRPQRVGLVLQDVAAHQRERLLE